LQTATDGRGVVVARSVRTTDAVVVGRLIRLNPKVKLASQRAHYVVYRAESFSLPKIVAFRKWLMKEAAATG
jgi:LysR family glycine cleavage system transcriptional activator